MSEDIFVPKSSPDDAVVGPLHTITLITADKPGVEKLLVQGYGFDSSGWSQPGPADLTMWNTYLGFALGATWEANAFFKSGPGANAQIRVIHTDQDAPLVRPAHEGLYRGGATISCPMTDMRGHEKVMSALGFKSTIGVKEMEFTSPTGETYISGEIVYLAPDNIFMMGVTRPDIFVPVGPIDEQTGVGGPAYSARCVLNTDKVSEFLVKVLGYEIRRDVEFTVGEKSAINMPEGTTERFIQAFAPGAQTGYLVLMDHGDATKEGDAPTLGPPNRGIGMWSFETKDINKVHERAKAAGIEIVHAPGDRNSPFLNASTSMLMLDPDGFPIEIFQT